MDALVSSNSKILCDAPKACIKSPYNELKIANAIATCNVYIKNDASKPVDIFSSCTNLPPYLNK